MDIILPFVVLLRVCNKNFAIEIADAKWSITCRKVWICEAVGINLIKVFIEGMDFACMEICRIQEIVTVGDADRCAFINGAVHTIVRAVIDGYDGVRPIHRWVPTRDGTVFTDKNEKSGCRVSIFCHLEERGGVADLSSGIASSSVPRSGRNRHDQ